MGTKAEHEDDVCQKTPCDLCKEREHATIINVRLEIQGKAGAAIHIVDRLLDTGGFQDSINEYDGADEMVSVLDARVSEGDHDERLRALADVIDLLWPIRSTARATLGAIYDRLAFLKPEEKPDRLIHMRCIECGYQDFGDPAVNICGKCGKGCVPTFSQPDGER